jgi:hypothetical protein
MAEDWQLIATLMGGTADASKKYLPYQRAGSTCPRIGQQGSRNGRMNKKDLSERDICSKFIDPAKYLCKRTIMMIRYYSC